MSFYKRYQIKKPIKKVFIKYTQDVTSIILNEISRKSSWLTRHRLTKVNILNWSIMAGLTSINIFLSH